MDGDDGHGDGLVVDDDNGDKDDNDSDDGGRRHYRNRICLIIFNTFFQLITFSN